MHLRLITHRPLVSQSQTAHTRRLLPLYIAAFSQGLVLWAPIEKVFLRSLGFDQAALGLMAASGVGALSSIAFVLFAALFGMVSQHAGVFRAGWMVVGVTLLVSVLLVIGVLGGGFKGSTAG